MHMLRLCILFILILISPIAQSEELRIYIWEEYLSEEVVERFEQETGHTIKQVFYENELLRDEVIDTGRGNMYDLIIVDGLNLQLMAKRGLFRSLSDQPVANVEHISKQSVEACGPSGIPYMWGTMGIVYRASQTKKAVDSWMALFKPAPEHLGKMTVPVDDIDTTSIALLALNLNPFTGDTAELTQAFQLLKTLNSNVLAFRNTAAYVLENQTDSKVSIGVGYSGESVLLNDENQVDDWTYVVPQEGTLIWYECFASPSGKPLSKASVDFLSFINRPDIAALNAESVWAATTNDSAIKLTSDEYRTDSELFPPDEVLKKSFYYQPIEEEDMKLRYRMVSALNQ